MQNRQCFDLRQNRFPLASVYTHENGPGGWEALRPLPPGTPRVTLVARVIGDPTGRSDRYTATNPLRFSSQSLLYPEPNGFAIHKPRGPRKKSRSPSAVLGLEFSRPRLDPVPIWLRDLGPGALRAGLETRGSSLVLPRVRVSMHSPMLFLAHTVSAVLEHQGLLGARFQDFWDLIMGTSQTLRYR